jgi:hypothetical protein
MWMIVIGVILWLAAVYLIHQRTSAPDKWPVGWVEALMIGSAVWCIASPLLGTTGSPGLKVMITVVAALGVATITAVVLQLLRR